MRLLPGLVLVLVGVALVHSKPIASQSNHVNAVISLLPQIQGFVNQLNAMLPQLAGIISSGQLQSLKDKIIQLVLAQIGDKIDLDALKDKLRPILQQYLGSKPDARVDIDALLQQIAGAAAAALPGILLGLFGKRDVPSADARSLDQIMSLVNTFQLSALIPEIELFLGPDKLQELQNLFFTTVVSALGNNWNMATVAQVLQQLVTQFVPQVSQMRIDWDAIGQSALNGLASALPGIAVGLLGLFGKRDLPSSDDRSIDQIMSLVDTFQLSALIPEIELFLGPDKLQELQNLFFTTVVSALGNNWNMATVAQALQQLVTQFVPQVSQMRIDWDAIGQSALNGLASALPGIAVGLLGLFGKRDLPSSDDRSIDQIMSLVDTFHLSALIPEIELFLGPDKLQELQNLFFTTVVSALGNNWNMATVAQALQQLVTQFVPQVSQMRIDWDAVGQSALNGLVGALPGIAVGLLGLFGKRHLTIDYQQLLAQLSVNQLAQLVAVVNNSDKDTVVAELQQLLQHLFPAYQGRINFDDLAANLLNHLNSLLPGLSQSIFGSIFG